MKVSNATLTFDDTGPALPDSDQITTGTYRPTAGVVFDSSHVAPTDFPSPAPAHPYSLLLSDLNGDDPNGTWSLYCIDDSGGESGSIAGGWSLTFNPVPPTLTPTVTTTPTTTSTPTNTPTNTPTSTPTNTPTLTPTGTATTVATTPTSTATATATRTLQPTSTPTLQPTSTPTATPVQERDPESQPLTQEQRLQHQHTNTANQDDYRTEGNVVAVDPSTQPPTVTIGTRDGLVTIVLLCGNQCPKIRVGDYIEVKGVKENEQLFYADEVTVSR